MWNQGEAGIATQYGYVGDYLILHVLRTPKRWGAGMEGVWPVQADLLAEPAILVASGAGWLELPPLLMIQYFGMFSNT